MVAGKRFPGFLPSMRLSHGIDLGYCTNIHRGETWEETFHGLRQYTDAVRKRVCPDEPYGVGLRLSAAAAKQLRGDAGLVAEFRRWLDETNSYVFTINGFPYGTFHGSRVKEQVYVPDWTRPERLEYTKMLFDLLVEIAPGADSLGVSSLPGSFKEFVPDSSRGEQTAAMVANLRECSEHIERLRDRSGIDLHLSLEPEPLGFFETSAETVLFFDELRSGLEVDEEQRLLRNVGVNYDTCHLAVEYEEPADVVAAFDDAGLRIGKIHLSSALRLRPEPDAIARLADFSDEVYLHQVVVREGKVVTRRFRDLPDAFDFHQKDPASAGDEWRVHFHVPLHASPEPPFVDTRDHIEGLLAVLSRRPELCRHFEMETYTWEVLPPSMRAGDVVDQIAAEYDWCLGEFRRAGLAE